MTIGTQKAHFAAGSKLVARCERNGGIAVAVRNFVACWWWEAQDDAEARNMIRGAVFAFCLLCAVAARGEEVVPPKPQLDLQPDLLDAGVESASFVLVDRAVSFAEDRVLLEVEGARDQAEDWLHQGGFSLLEERDQHGRSSYVVMSQTFSRRVPTMRIRARMGRPELSAGMRLNDESPAVGITVPWQRYTFELEGLNDGRFGYAVVGSARWSKPNRRLQYGVAMPVALSRGPSVGLILQFGVRFGK